MRIPNDSVGWVTSFGKHAQRADLATGLASTQCRISKMSEKSSSSPPSGEDAAASRVQVSLGPYMRPRPFAGVGVVAAPHEQTRKVQAVIRMQMRQQDVDRSSGSA